LQRAEEEPEYLQVKEHNTALTAELRELKRIQTAMTSEIEGLKKSKSDATDKMVRQSDSHILFVLESRLNFIFL
jgi:hypothetical protein